MRAHVHDDIQVAGRAAVRARRAATLHANALTVGDARGHAHLDLARTYFDTPPVTRRARSRDDLTAPAARGAHLRERERALVDRDRPRPVTLRTRLGHRARRGARTRARGARRVGTESHRRRDAA